MQVALTSDHRGQFLLKGSFSEPHIGLFVIMTPEPSASVASNFFCALEQGVYSADIFRSVLTLLIRRYLLFNRVIMRSDYDELCRTKHF